MTTITFPQRHLVATFLQTRYGRRFADRAQLERWQEQQVQKHLQQILPRSPFFQAQANEYGREQWRVWPLLNKQRMMANIDQINTVGLTKKSALQVALEAEESRDFTPVINDITIGLSTGTSGNRGLFLVSPAERYRWAGAVFAKLLSDPLWRRQRIAFFLRANSNLYTTVHSRHIEFRFFDLLDPLATHIQRLNRYNPTYLIAPASLLRFLADQQTAGALHISPRKIVSVAEVLDPLDEQIIANAFQQQIHQVYQCTEGFLGSTCAHGTLHLHEDIAVIQRDLLPTAEGGSRKFAPIITDFQRTSQPIIRYRLDDVLTIKEEGCACGSVMTPIQTIAGRCDDIFLLPSQTDPLRLIHLFPDYVRRAIISASPDIQAYTAVQQAPDRIVIALGINDGARPLAEQEIQENVKNLLNRIGAKPIHLKFIELDPEIPSDIKRRRVMRRPF